MKAAVIDFYDDMGALLGRLVPDRTLIPDFVKQASVVSRSSHPNQFAVVMVDGDQVINRYPLHDPGNAWLSALYFHDTHEVLTGEAQKVAAAHIKVAMEHFGMDVPQYIEDAADGEEPTSNVVNITGRGPAVRMRPTVQDDDARDDANHALERADGSKIYPLNDASAARTAADYFDTHKHAFTFRERHEFAVKTAAALDRAGLPMTDSVAEYGSETYSPRLQAFIDVRNNYLLDMGDAEAASMLRKLAAKKNLIDPVTFAQNLETFDRDVGLDKAWDRDIPDPWFSTFFMRAGMQKVADTGGKTYQCGVDHCTQADLMDLATARIDLVRQSFGDEIANSFQKEPIAAYESMPAPQKSILTRLATQR